MKKHYRHENDCLNCGAELQGKFCHVCGQENLEMKESFGHMLNHAISDYFHFDYQFFHTLKPLLFEPGKLTTEYLRGRRMQYLHPVKMYIFISLVYFLLMFKQNHEVVKINDNGKLPAQTEISNRVNKALDKKNKLSAEQKKQIDKAIKPYSADAPLIIVNEDKPQDSTLAQYNANQLKLPFAKRDGFAPRFYNEKRIAYVEKYGKNAREEFFEQVRHNIPKMMFVLLPIFALILQIAFLKNKKYYVEDVIHAIHIHCNYFLVSAVVLLIQMILPTSWDAVNQWIGLFKLIYVVWYFYRSLRVIYQRSGWRTVSKMIGISLMYLVFFVVCFMGLIMVTAESV